MEDAEIPAGPDKFTTRRGVVVFRLTKKQKDGTVHVAKNFSMRRVRNYKQYYFALPSNKRDAGELADKIDRFLDSPVHTIEEAIKRFNPDKWEKLNPLTKAATVGAVLDAHEAAEKAIGIDHVTGKSYRGSLLIMFRQALAYRRKSKAPSAETVREMTLDELTPQLVSDFKLSRLARAGDNKSDLEQKKRSANAVFREVCGIFTESAREHYSHLTLPPDLDKVLKTMAYRRVEKKKYRLPPGPVIERVMGDAGDLRNGCVRDGVAVPPDLNAYLAWLLAGHAGLRKNEIGHAVREWIQDGKPPRVWIRSTPEFIAKGKDEGFSEVEQWVIDEINALAQGPALILAGKKTERCEKVFFRLNQWLKARGLGAVKGEKAVHALRALFGSYVASTRGIFTAQKFLRHKTVDVTNDCYADAMLDKTLHRFWTERPAWLAPVTAEVEVISV